MALDENVGGLLSFTSSGNLSSNQYQPVALDTAGKIAVAGDGVACVGILYTKPDADGVIASVHPLDGRKCKGKAGAAITKGDKLASNASGKLVIATTGEFAVGVAVESAAGADEIIQFVAVSLGRVA